MTYRHDDCDSSIDLLMGLCFGLLGGSVLALLFAPRSGSETREFIKENIKDLPQKMDKSIGESKDLFDRAKMGIENQLDMQRRRKAARIAGEARKREEQDAGIEELS